MQKCNEDLHLYRCEDDILVKDKKTTIISNY